MIAGHSFGACISTFGNCADRFCLSGYGGATTLEGMLDLAQTKLDILSAQLFFIGTGPVDHFRGHIHPDHLAALPDLLGRQEAVDPAA